MEANLLLLEPRVPGFQGLGLRVSDAVQEFHHAQGQGVTEWKIGLGLRV